MSEFQEKNWDEFEDDRIVITQDEETGEFTKSIYADASHTRLLHRVNYFEDEEKAFEKEKKEFIIAATIESILTNSQIDVEAELQKFADAIDNLAKFYKYLRKFNVSDAMDVELLEAPQEADARFQELINQADDVFDGFAEFFRDKVPQIDYIEGFVKNFLRKQGIAEEELDDFIEREKLLEIHPPEISEDEEKELDKKIDWKPFRPKDVE